MLEIKNLHFSYGEKAILKGVSLLAAKGEILALIGISGSGKTTLFRLINGLISPSAGETLIDGKPLPEGAYHLTYMRQDDLLLPWRTVMENLSLITELGVNSRADPQFRKKALSLLQQLGLSDYANRYPDELSGGMRQRVSLARALLQNRPVMLLDEPFASLDVILREQLYCLVREIRDRYGKTIVMVTHDFRDAIALADRILVLNQGLIVGTYCVPAPSQNRALAVEVLIEQIRSNLMSVTQEV